MLDLDPSPGEQSRRDALVVCLAGALLVTAIAASEQSSDNVLHLSDVLVYGVGVAFSAVVLRSGRLRERWLP